MKVGDGFLLGYRDPVRYCLGPKPEKFNVFYFDVCCNPTLAKVIKGGGVNKRGGSELSKIFYLFFSCFRACRSFESNFFFF